MPSNCGMWEDEGILASRTTELTLSGPKALAISFSLQWLFLPPSTFHLLEKCSDYARWGWTAWPLELLFSSLFHLLFLSLLPHLSLAGVFSKSFDCKSHLGCLLNAPLPSPFCGSHLTCTLDSTGELFKLLMTKLSPRPIPHQKLRV